MSHPARNALPLRPRRMLTKALHLKPGPCGTTPCTLCAGELSITTNLRARGGATGLLLAAPEIEIIAHHAVLTDLEPDTRYIYSVEHDGSSQQYGTFTTAPARPRRVALHQFRRSGDSRDWQRARLALGRLQPTADRSHAAAVPPAQRRPVLREHQSRTASKPGATSSFRTRCPLGIGPGCRPPATTRTRSATASLAAAPIRRSFRCPTMASRTPSFRGMWYSFKAGGVRVISLNNDDVCLQDGGDNYVRGYSDGAQTALARAHPSAGAR